MEEHPRISVIDDDASVRRALDRLCRSAGYLVDSYESAEAFLESDAEEAKCLILDVHLPGKSGLDVQSELRLLGRRIPIVFITAFDDEQTAARALEDGAIEFLRKPLDTEHLLDAIQRALSSHLS